MMPTHEEANFIGEETAQAEGCACADAQTEHCTCADVQAERDRLALEGQPDEELLYDLADLFKVFSDTTRIKILFALMERDLNVGEIAETIGASQSAVSHQLRSVKQARLVKFTRSGKTVTYSLSDDHVYVMLAQGLTHICE